MICARCGTTLAVGDFPFCKGQARDHARGTSTIVGDECDITQVNGTAQPIRFRSKQARLRWMKAHGYRAYDQHVTLPGTDKSEHTTNWTARMDPYTANNVRILLERAFHAPTRPAEPPLDLHITTYTGELSREDAQRYV